MLLSGVVDDCQQCQQRCKRAGDDMVYFLDLRGVGMGGGNLKN